MFVVFTGFFKQPLSVLPTGQPPSHPVTGLTQANGSRSAIVPAIA